jgi:hypothetical protein
LITYLAGASWSNAVKVLQSSAFRDREKQKLGTVRFQLVIMHDAYLTSFLSGKLTPNKCSMVDVFFIFLQQQHKILKSPEATKTQSHCTAFFFLCLQKIIPPPFDSNKRQHHVTARTHCASRNRKWWIVIAQY